VIERIFAIREAAEIATCEETAAFSHGTLLRTTSLPGVYQLNALRLESDASAEDVLREADRLQADLAHRKAITRLPEPGERLLLELADAGWSTERVAVMAWEGGATGPEPGAARELGHAEAARVREAFYRASPLWRGEEAMRQLLERDDRFNRAFDVRELGAPVEGEPLSYCRLLAHGDLAEVDFVETAEAARGRGLGRQVVLAATEMALDGGHEGVFLLADSEDWTAGWYERLGFRTVGYEYEFTRMPDGPRP
jgi:ribosomal protein S18 acetylase RimI-like enzyme